MLYCTDLFHPHDDPDDHFDLATLYAIPDLEVRGIVLDQGDKQLQRPGHIPIDQLNALTGRRVPWANGLGAKLTSPVDSALAQPETFQGGVRLILDTLRAATGRVDLIAVGSVRDVVAAFHREPALVRQKLGRVLVFIGEASNPDFREYNVDLDLHAYVGLMRSGLNVYWVPCFDGGLWKNQGHASFWQATQAQLLERAPSELLQFFIYALEKEKAEPLGFLRQPVDPARRDALFGQTRNLWCTVIFESLVLWHRGAAAQPSAAFSFEPLSFRIGDDGVVREVPKSETGADVHSIHRFRVLDMATYAATLTRATADRLAAFPLAPQPGTVK